MTERLYYTDPYSRDFDATIARVEPRNGGASVVLDRTFFYPTSGGQPFDTGTLGGAKVVDVVDDDSGEIQHIIDARAALPGAVPISINVPPPTGVYAISARYPEDLTPGGRSRLFVDQYSGAVLAAEGSRTAPPGSRLITLNRAIHTGDVFGVPSKIVMSLASLALVAQFVTGVLWWVRKRITA